MSVLLTLLLYFTYLFQGVLIIYCLMSSTERKPHSEVPALQQVFLFQSFARRSCIAAQSLQVLPHWKNRSGGSISSEWLRGGTALERALQGTTDQGRERCRMEVGWSVLLHPFLKWLLALKKWHRSIIVSLKVFHVASTARFSTSGKSEKQQQ